MPDTRCTAFPSSRSSGLRFRAWNSRIVSSSSPEPDRVSGVLDPNDVAQLCLQAIRDEQFLILPHPEVATYTERKATDRDRWLAGMRRFQSSLHPDGNLPGNAIAP